MEAWDHRVGDSDVRRYWVPLLLFALALTLRLIGLGTESLWNDELSSVVFSNSGPMAALRSAMADTGPPLYYIVQSLVNEVLGVHEWSMRLVPALAGAASVPLLYGLGRRLAGERVAIIAAVMLAVAEVPLSMSQEARAYAPGAFLVLLSVYCLVRAVETSGSLWLVGYAVAAAAAAYTHLFAGVAVAGATFGVLIRPRLVTRVGWRLPMAIVGALVAWLPWAWVLFDQTARVAAREAAGQWRISAPADFSTSLFEALRFYVPWGRRDPIVAGLFVGMIFYGAFGRPSNNDAEQQREGDSVFTRADATVVLLSWSGFVFLGGLLISRFVLPIFGPRMAVMAAPALYLLLAMGVVKLWRPAVMLVAAVVIVYGSRGLSTYYTELQREQWREVTQYLVAENAEEDGIIAHAPFILKNVSTYAMILGDDDGIEGLRLSRGLDPKEYERVLLGMLEGRDSVYLVQGHVDFSEDRKTDADLAMENLGWRARETRWFKGGWVIHYTRGEATAE